ncbi:MAG: acetate/propionate family kinase, partial [Paracoccaceae bacterium]
LAVGLIDRIGGEATFRLRANGTDLPLPLTGNTAYRDHATALTTALTAVHQNFAGLTIARVGHRVVHGGPDFTAPAVITPKVLDQIRALAPFAPLHQPHNLSGILAAQSAFPNALQLACFDTSFHRSQPWENDTYALPRRYYDQGIRRYGFHGLSYDYIAGELARTEPRLRRVIVAHLGNGASMCALHEGRSIASTMGFTALDGLAMGTRTGQIDPGVLLYLMEQEGLDAPAITDLLYRQSGLLGLSGLSNDMRTLLASPTSEAAQAVTYFCTRIQREIGSLTAALGGLDALIFTGGIGENAAPIRARVCEGMGWLGITLNAEGISTGAVRVMVIPTDEERVIARATLRALA